MNDIKEQALDAGFTKSQAEFIAEHLAVTGHTHLAGDIEDLEEVVSELADEDEEDEEE